MKRFVLTISGRPHEAAVQPDPPLLNVLRNDLGLKGSRYGCGPEQCNACKVLIHQTTTGTAAALTID